MNEIVRINLDDYKVIKFIGSGSFGKVYLIENKNTFIQYAAKETEKQDEHRLIENDFYREIKSLSKTNNHSILNLIGYSLQNFEKKWCPTMVLEYMKNGSLEQNLLKKSKEFTRNKYIILLGIALGMK